MTSGRVAAALGPRAPAAALSGEELRGIAEALAGEDGLTAKQNSFSRTDAVRGFAEALVAGTSVEHLVLLADWFLNQDDLVVPLADGRYTTPGLLDAERRLLSLVADGRDSGTAIVGVAEVAAALAAASVELSAEQRRAVCQITQSGHAIENLEARAGTGKTVVAAVIADAYTRAGYTVIGATPTARAARELRSVGVQARTIDAILAQQRRRPTPAPERLVVIADENGMSGTRQMTRLASWARASGAKIIQIGDSHQLAGVNASGAFAEITRRHGATHLTTVRRQTDPAEITALDDLRSGAGDTYLAHQLRRGRIHIATTTESAVEHAAAWWHAAAQAYGADQVAIITRDNTLRSQINTLIRQQRLDRGEITGPSVETPHDVGFQRGDRVICRRNDYRLGVDNGTRATITTIHPDRRLVTIRADNGHTTRLDASYLDAGHLEHAYALTAHNLQGATVETALVVTHPDDHDTHWTYTAASRARSTTNHVIIDGERLPDARAVLARTITTINHDHTDQLAHAYAPVRRCEPKRGSDRGGVSR